MLQRNVVSSLKTTRPRILHLTHEMNYGGTQQVIKQLVTNLDEDKFECEIACIDGVLGPLGEELCVDGLVVHVLNRGSGFDRKLISRLRALLRDGSYDLIHCHQYTPYVYGVIASMLTNVKVVFTEHGRFYPDRYSWRRRMVNPVLSIFTDSTIAISKATKQALSYYEWIPSGKIQVIYNGLSNYRAPDDLESVLNRFQLPVGALVFGTIARFDPIKNIPMMIKAFAQVHKKNPDTCLLLVGDGEERQALEELSRTIGVHEAVVFTGFQQNTSDLISVIDVYLLTSYSEGTSMTLLEAMASATGSIVTGVGGNTELIEHKVNGIVVDSDHTESLAEWMSLLATDSQTRNELGLKACETFNTRFSLETMINNYTKTYNSVLNCY